MVHLLDKYYLNADQYNYVLVRKEKYKEGKHVGEWHDVTVGYVTNIPHAMQLIYKVETREFIAEHDCEIKEAIAEFERIQQSVVEWGKKIDKNKYEKTKRG